MRGDKTLARILLISSIANVILAAPVLAGQRRSGDDSMDGLTLQDLVPASPHPSDAVSEHGPPPGSVGHNLVPPAPPTPVAALGQDWEEESLPSSSDVSSPHSSLGWSDQDSTHKLPSSLHQDSVPKFPSDSSHQDLAEALKSHDDLPSVSGGPRLQEAPFPWWEHTNWRPPSQWEVGESSSRMQSAAQGGSPPALGSQPLHDDSLVLHHDDLLPLLHDSLPSTPLLHDDSFPSTPSLHDDSFPSTPSLHDDSFPSFPVHDGPPPGFPLHDGSLPSFPLHDGLLPSFPLHDSSPPSFPVHDGSPPSFPVHDGSPPSLPVHDGSLPSFPVHDPWWHQHFVAETQPASTAWGSWMSGVSEEADAAAKDAGKHLHLRRSFEWSRQRDDGHRFSWGRNNC